MKNNIQRILSLLLSFFIIMLVFLLLIKTRLINEKYYIKVFNDNSASTEIYDSLNNDIKSLYVKNNLSLNDNEFKVDKDTVSNDFENDITNIFGFFKGKGNSVDKISTDKYITSFNEQLPKNIQFTKEQNALIDNVRNESMDTIKTNIDIFSLNKYLTSNGVFGKVQKVGKILDSNILLVVITVLVLLNIILIISVNKIKSLKYISGSMIISSVLLGSISLGGYLSKMYYNSSIGSEWFRKSIGDIIKSCFVNMTIVSLIILFIGIILLSISLKIEEKDNSYN